MNDLFQVSSRVRLEDYDMSKVPVAYYKVEGGEVTAWDIHPFRDFTHEGLYATRKKVLPPDVPPGPEDMIVLYTKPTVYSFHPHDRHPDSDYPTAREADYDFGEPSG